MMGWLRMVLSRGGDRFSAPVPCIDAHAHVLPGVDDGPVTIEAAVEALRHAEAAGVTHVVATPHASARYETSWDAIAAARGQLVAALREAQVAVTLLIGREVMFTDETLARVATDARLRIEGGKYALVELAEGLNMAAVTEGLASLRAAGVRPILAHPERNWLVQRHTDCVQEWRLRGTLVQINAASVTGTWGADARRAARRLLEREAVDMLGSDAHRAEDYDAYRRACAAIEKQYGVERIEQLVRTTPAYVTNITL